jgi:hypothetical protein
MWLIEATRHNVLQLDDRGIERALPEFVGRPTLVKGNRQPLFGGMRLVLDVHDRVLGSTL